MSTDAAVSDFIERLQRRVKQPVQPTSLPPADDALRAVDPHSDLVACFAAAAEAAGCRVHRTVEEQWMTCIEQILTEHGVRSVLMEPQPKTALTAQRAAALGRTLTERRTAARAEAHGSDGLAVETERSDAVLFEVRAAVTGVLAATAETGTLVCASGASSARGTSLIPPVHVAVVGQSQIVADLFDTFAWLDRLDGLPANVNLITGPSKTADIEGVLVTGVHGPGVVHVVLLEEEGP